MASGRSSRSCRTIGSSAPSCRDRAPRRWRARAMNLFLRQFWPRLHFRLADLVFDLGLLLRLAAADLPPAPRNFDGLLAPERERLPSMERPPASIIAA